MLGGGTPRSSASHPSARPTHDVLRRARMNDVDAEGNGFRVGCKANSMFPNLSEDWAQCVFNFQEFSHKTGPYDGKALSAPLTARAAVRVARSRSGAVRCGHDGMRVRGSLLVAHGLLEAVARMTCGCMFQPGKAVEQLWALDRPVRRQGPLSPLCARTAVGIARSRVGAVRRGMTGCACVVQCWLHMSFRMPWRG